MIGLKINELMGLGGWTPAYKFVNLFINNDYRGIYMLVESIKRNKDCRLNVDKQTGYIIECDAYWWNEDVYFASYMNKKYTFKYPDEEDITENQLSYIRQVVNNVETAIDNGTYPSYIDVPSFAAWMLAHDLLGTYDSGGANIYLTKYDNTNDSKLCMSVLWDFSSIMKTTNQWARIHTGNFFYFNQLFNNSNVAFATEYTKLWNQKSDDIIRQMLSFLNSFSNSYIATAISQSRWYDSQRWNYEASTVSENVQEAILWFTNRKHWMDEQLQASAIIDIHNEHTSQQTPVYNLNGTKMDAQPLKPGIYIKNNKKFVVK
jgi:spore coat protein CotH